MTDFRADNVVRSWIESEAEPIREAIETLERYREVERETGEEERRQEGLGV